MTVDSSRSVDSAVLEGAIARPRYMTGWVALKLDLAVALASGRAAISRMMPAMGEKASDRGWMDRTVEIVLALAPWRGDRLGCSCLTTPVVRALELKVMGVPEISTMRATVARRVSRVVGAEIRSAAFCFLAQRRSEG